MYRLKAVFYALLLIAATLSAQDTGFVVIHGSSDITIFVDGENKGPIGTEAGINEDLRKLAVSNSNNDSELMLLELSTGEHTLKAVIDDEAAITQPINIEVESDSITKMYVVGKVPQFTAKTWNFERIAKNMNITYKTGTLAIATIPAKAKISIPNLRDNNRSGLYYRLHTHLQEIDIPQQGLLVNDILTGEYELICTLGEEEMRTKFRIEKDVQTEIVINFINKKIDIQKTDINLPESKSSQDDEVKISFKSAIISKDKCPKFQYYTIGLPREIAKEISFLKDTHDNIQTLESSLEKLSKDFEPISPVMRATENKLTKFKTELKENSASLQQALDAALGIADQKIFDLEEHYAAKLEAKSPNDNSMRDIINRIKEYRIIKSKLEELELFLKEYKD